MQYRAHMMGSLVLQLGLGGHHETLAMVFIIHEAAETVGYDYVMTSRHLDINIRPGCQLASVNRLPWL